MRAPRGLREAARGLDDELIAGLLAHDFRDGAEAIELHHEDGMARVGIARARRREALVEERTVREPGGRVVIDQALDVAALFLALAVAGAPRAARVELALEGGRQSREPGLPHAFGPAREP